MITFDLTYTFDPTAQGGYLEYRRVNPDGTSTLWEIAINNIGLLNGYITPLTGTLTGVFGGVQGNISGIVDFMYNTTYQFRLRQVCDNGSEIFSPIDGDYYVLQCPPFVLSGSFSETQSGYVITTSLFPFNNLTSVSGYQLMIYDNISLPPLASYFLDQTTALTGNPYDFLWDNVNVPGGVTNNTTYYVMINVIITTSTGSITSTNLCDAISINTPICDMYEILTGDSWYLEWTDCDGNLLSCGSNTPYRNNNGVPAPFYVCCIGKPDGYYCANGILLPPVLVAGIPTLGAYVNLLAGTCNPSLYNYDTNVAPPELNGAPCSPCI